MAEFEARWPSDDDDWTPIEAVDARDAAERHAARICSRDNECYSTFENGGESIEVRRARTVHSVTYRVTCSFDPTFRAEREQG